MTKVVTALFESEREAEQVVDALKDAGYRGDSIRNVEGEGEPWSGVFRIDREVLEYYAKRIPEGYTLVVVACVEEELGEVERIIQEFDVVDPDEIVASMVEAAERAEGKRVEGKRRRPRLETGEPTGRWFDVAEIKEEEWVEREGARAHAVHVRPKKGLDRVSVAGVPGSEQHPIFERLEPGFQRHYRDELSDSRYSYEEMKLAYRYGVQLGENRRFHQQQWPEVEEHARKSWEKMEEMDWSVAKRAVRYGWEQVPRGSEEQRPR